jgi:hypothetical protein
MYGIIQNGILQLNSAKLAGYKPIEYADIPDFDQAAQYIMQSAPIDQGDKILIGVETRELVITDSPPGSP